MMQHQSMKLILIFLLLNFSLGANPNTQKTKELAKGPQQEISAEAVGAENEYKLKLGQATYEIFSKSQIKNEGDTISLIRGVLRVRGENLVSIKIQTPVGVVTVSGADIIVHYAPEKAIATVQVLKGSALLQGHYREEILNIQENEKGEFVGVPEGDSPAYDVLLRGRKAIRGGLRGPEKLSEEQVKQLAAQYQIKKRPAPKSTKNKAKPGQICSSPFAKFNECVWRCQNNPKGKKDCQIQNSKVECVRQKCLANGEWGDTKVLKGDARQVCKTEKDSVAVCDY